MEQDTSAQPQSDASSDADAPKEVEAYCVKCKAKRIMKDPEEVTMKNGKPAVKGTCPECSTSMFRIGKPKPT